MMDGTQWGIILGTLTLVCWIAAGLISVLEIDHELRSGEMGKGGELVVVGLTTTGLLSTVAMVATMVLL
jgi:hypothetical protein